MQKPIRKHHTFLLVLLLTAVSCGDRQVTPGTAITNVTVIDAKLGARSDQTVIFDGDRIVEVGPAVSASTAAENIDGTGKFLIPGLWDMHVHLTYDDRFTASMPQDFIRYGITSVRDTGGLMSNLLPVIERMRAEDAIAPRVYFSGPLLDGESVVYDGLDRPEIGTANATAEAARANVARLKEQGVDFVKIYEMVNPEVFATLVDAAQSHNLPIAAHVPLSMRASQVAPFVGSMEHLRNVELDCAANFEELQQARLQRLAANDGESGFSLRSSLHSLQRLDAIDALDEQRCKQVLESMANTVQVPTARLNTLSMFPVFERDDWETALSALPDAVREEWSKPPVWFDPDASNRDMRFPQYTLDMIARMYAAGVPIGAGTDTPIGRALPGYSLHRELEILVQAGLPPLEALRAATLRPAEFFLLDNEMGNIEQGMRADLVLLDADPLADIRNTRAINLVISRGRMVSTPSALSERMQSATSTDGMDF